MDIENLDEQEGGADDALPATPPTPPAPAPQAAPTRDPLMVQLPQAAFTKLKASERERGKRAALEALEAEARSLGWASYAEMREAAAALKRAPQQPQRQAQPQPQPQYEQPAPGELGSEDLEPPQHARSRQAQQVQRLLDDRRRLNRSVTHAQRKRVAAEQALAAQEAETALRVAAARAGVRDVDYSLTILRRKMEAMTEEDLHTFDEDQFFSQTLREEHPFLFGVEERPATTGTHGAAPTPATTRASDGAPLPPGSVDAKKLTREEYDRMLRERGLLNPAVGSSSTF